jgi:hypothetical protein
MRIFAFLNRQFILTIHGFFLKAKIPGNGIKKDL